MSSYMESLFGLAGKHVVITGAGGQLGRVLTQGFSEAGSRVLALDMKEPGKPLPSNTEFGICDIRREPDVAAAFVRAGRVDILINNAGVSCFEPFEERPEESFDWVMDVNLKGTFHCIRQFVKAANGNRSGGAIVNIGSIYGVISPDERIYTDCARRNSEVYGATKAGVIQMTRYFATHLARHGIRVNCVSPGGIRNPDAPQGEDFQKNYGARCPMGRMAELKEIVGAVMYFASDAAGYTTGQNLVVDGGMTAW
jgi:NAD(P)-dependent dehydrogenase (short-subunit alcohol dehydrogenase family)